MKVVAALIALLFVCFANCDEQTASPARLLIEKKILNKYLVEGRDIVVHYNIYNVGESAAVNVQISDDSLPSEHFDIVNGLNKFTIARLAPATNITHTVVYRPKAGVWGRFNFTAAQVNYLRKEDSTEVQRGQTSEPGEGYIVSLKEFDRRFSPHVLDWIAFSVMTLPSLVIPFLLWFRSKSKYEAIIASKPLKKH
ncbi:signal sequence receptor beta-like protein [Leptotrombidium deliense]|uniref:Translocon-associated protein subunit beta n=1 Tax=Leptotrombidium deliense TaxID=299467 RepID=A0A443SQ94_9ACAR|nr:signal sequence receptor beta-like protein [Leptotrombidium deliense]